MSFPELHKRVKKAGQPPGTFTYTGSRKKVATHISVINFSEQEIHEASGATPEECLPATIPPGISWIDVQGLNNISIIEQITRRYDIHPLTVEDILNVSQRPKAEEFPDYEFVTLKLLVWNAGKNKFSTEQLSIIFGNNFILSFQENNNALFDDIKNRLKSEKQPRLRQQGSDYLAYRLIDTVVDYYFEVLEGLSAQIDTIEDQIISDPQPKNTRAIYQLKRQVLMLRKAIWPLREVISHLLQVEEKFISAFVRIYMRDLYDHIVQAIDTIEIFRDMLSNILDVYLSSITNRLNEVMKTLTIIATIFIPMTFIASVYGMNFVFMPELHWHWGYYVALGLMGAIAFVMLIYFRRKKWL